MLLEARQLTPTQFADAIGIARPIVSHILSGRNKPSLEVVQRILAAMPDLSMPWLLNGTGPMLSVADTNGSNAVNQLDTAKQLPEENHRASVVSTASVAGSQASAASLGSRVRLAAPVMQPRSIAPAGPAPKPKRFAPSTPQLIGSSIPLSQESQPVTPSDDETPVPQHAAQLLAGAEKPIRRIVIFYRDGSFADYQPE